MCGAMEYQESESELMLTCRVLMVNLRHWWVVGRAYGHLTSGLVLRASQVILLAVVGVVLLVHSLLLLGHYPALILLVHERLLARLHTLGLGRKWGWFVEAGGVGTVAGDRWWALYEFGG